MSEQKITVLGAGAWGTAIATLLARNGHHVTLWSHEPEVAYEIAKTHTNSQYLPDTKLDPNIITTSSLQEAVTGASIIFEAVPVKFLRQILCHPRLAVPAIAEGDGRDLGSMFPSSPSWVILSKGLEQKTLFLPSQIIQDVFKQPITYAVLGGPSFAKELADGQFTTATIASTNQELIAQLRTLLNNPYFKTFESQDPIGTQVCGAVKNIFALIIGIAYGSGYKENTASYLITQGLHEIAALIEHLGGDPQTAYGLSGLGDLILSCTGTLGRNLKAGRLLAQDRSIENLSLNFKTLPEGINTLLSLHELIKRDKINLPLCQAAYEFIFQNKPFSVFLNCHPELVSGSKNTKLVIAYNDLELFKNTYLAYNLSFEKDITQDVWINYFPKVIESLENQDLTYYFHALKDENSNVISFIFGNFYQDRPGTLYIDYLGTVPAFRERGLAWQLVLSLFDHYPHLHTIEVDTLESADSFYRKHGFTKVGEKDALHPIISPDPIHLSIFQLYRSDVADELRAFTSSVA